MQQPKKKYIEVLSETELDDDIVECMDDALSNGEGHTSAYYLRYELRQRRLKIVAFSTLFIIGALSAAGALTFVVAVVALAPPGYFK
jgi:hypothetical protein